jgi:predicted outer membrane repeat protein
MFPDVFRHVRCGIAGGAVVLAFAATSIAGAAIIYVDDDAPSAGNGTSWPAAFNDLQLALAIAQDGDEIRVAQGIYKPAPPNGPRTATFNLVNGTTLRGGYAGIGASDPDENDPTKFESILSGDLNGDDGPNFTNITDNSFHVITASADLTSSTALHGMTVTAGNASELDLPHSAGAGILCMDQAHPTIAQCKFLRNRARNGGGISGEGPLRISQSTFIENQLFFSSTGYGAGALLGSAEVLESDFIGNHAFHGGGGISGDLVVVRACMFISNSGEDGGALHGGLKVIDSIFMANTSSFYGAGARSSGDFVNCAFIGNLAERGAGIWGSPTAVNCLFAGNRTWSPGAGAGVFITHEGALTNCTFVGNSVPNNFPSAQGGGIYKNGAGHLQIINCTLWDNEDFFGNGESSQLKIAAGSASVNDSCIQGWTGSLGGTGNHGNDPRFIDADGADDIYGTADDNPRLLPNSPLIDHGDTSALPPDTFDLDEDGDTTELLPVDLDWLPRIVNGTVDVGAYEFQGTPCLADITGDGKVNVADLLTIIGAWGDCVSGQPCNSDVTLDGTVGVSDLLLIITSWGACR